MHYGKKIKNDENQDNIIFEEKEDISSFKNEDKNNNEMLNIENKNNQQSTANDCLKLNTLGIYNRKKHLINPNIENIKKIINNAGINTKNKEKEKKRDENLINPNKISKIDKLFNKDKNNINKLNENEGKTLEEIREQIENEIKLIIEIILLMHNLEKEIEKEIKESPEKENYKINEYILLKKEWINKFKEIYINKDINKYLIDHLLDENNIVDVEYIYSNYIKDKKQYYENIKINNLKLNQNDFINFIPNDLSQL